MPTRSGLTAFVAVLALFFQLLAIPYHQAAASGTVAPDAAKIASELKATFGDAAALCVQANDKDAPTAPAGHSNDLCPLCQFAAQSAALVVPNIPALPVRLDASSQNVGLALETCGLPVCPTKQNRARAPPLAV